MKGSSSGAVAPSSGSSKSGDSKSQKGTSPIEAQGKRIHHGIEDGPIDIKGKFTNWPGSK